MKALILVVAAIAAIASGHAYAGSEQYVAGPSRPIYAAPPLRMTGSEAYPIPGGPASVVRSNTAANPTGAAGYQDFAGQASLDLGTGVDLADNGRAALPSAYRFETVGRSFQNGGIGKMHQVDSQSIVKVRLVHVPDGAVASDAILTKFGATMAPDGMPEMTARVSVLSSNDGVSRLVVHPSMSGDWALQLAADVPGGPKDLRGTVIASLAK